MPQKFIQEYQLVSNMARGMRETAKIIYSTRRESHSQREREGDKSATPFSKDKRGYIDTR